MRGAHAIEPISPPDTPALVPLVDRYACNGRPAVMLCEADTGEPWRDLTVNLPDYDLPDDDWTFVPADARPYACALERAGLIDEVGGFVAYGNFGQRAVAVRLDERLLEAGARGTGTGTEASA